MTNINGLRLSICLGNSNDKAPLLTSTLFENLKNERKLFLTQKAHELLRQVFLDFKNSSYVDQEIRDLMKDIEPPRYGFEYHQIESNDLIIYDTQLDDNIIYFNQVHSIPGATYKINDPQKFSQNWKNLESQVNRRLRYR